MNRKKNLRVGLVLVMSLILMGSIDSLAATATTNYVQSPNDVFITELQTASSKSSGEEFVELYNNTDNDIDLADTANAGKDTWKLQYFSGTKLPTLLPADNWTSPSRTIALTGIVPAHDYYVLAANAYTPANIEPDQAYSATLADDGGAVQLVDATAAGSVTTINIHSQLAWSNDTTLVASPLLYGAPAAGKSLQRLPNGDDEYVNDDGSLTTFIADSSLSPEGAWIAPVPSDPNDSDTDSTDSSDDGDDTGGDVPTVPDNAGLVAPLITELLPNPASPQSDEQDEYIELYNPNDTGFNLRGYTLETGQTTLHDFTFSSDSILPPQAYVAFYSSETGLPLSNSGSQVKLLSLDGSVLNESSVYGTAGDGQSWALDASNSEWHWTTTLTPGAANTFSSPVVTVKTAAVKATKKTKAKVKGVSTTRKAKTKKPKKSTQAANSQLASATTPTEPAPIHPLVLAGVVALGLGYMLYEYRQDVANRLYRFRTHRAARRRARLEAARR